VNQRTNLSFGVGLFVVGAALFALAAFVLGWMWLVVLGLAIAGYGCRWLIAYTVRYHSHTSVSTWAGLILLLVVLALLPIGALSCSG